MELFEAIHGRHTISKVKADSVPREMIQKILSAAVQAPNHYKVRPWRFVVLTGAGRERLGEVMAESLKQKFPELINNEEALGKERAKPLRAPVLIAVGVDRPSEAKVHEIENNVATSAAIQNMLLAVHGLGLGAILRTGDVVRDPRIKEFLGFTVDQEVLGILYIGYPDNIPAATVERPSFEDRTVWIEN